MAKRSDITAEYARQLLNYDPETGILTWKARTPDMFEDGLRAKEWRCRNWNAKFAGKRAGCICNGYQRIRVNDVLYVGHRLAWLITYGAWPDDELDHRNGTADGDSLINLRPATRQQNCQNLRLRSDNKSGHMGVSWNKSSSKWGARIKISGKYLHLGLFDEVTDAANAYLAAKAKYHPFQPIPRE